MEDDRKQPTADEQDEPTRREWVRPELKELDAAADTSTGLFPMTVVEAPFYFPS